MAQATGISDRTIRTGISKRKSPVECLPGGQRRPGGGKKPREVEQPRPQSALEKLIEPGTRCDPMSTLKWIAKRNRVVGRDFRRQGFYIGSTKIGELLKSIGYSLQSNRKTIEGKQHPVRNCQFDFIAKRIKSRTKRPEPAISVETKRKEVLGNLENTGRTYRKSKSPIEIETDDFPRRELGKAVPCGIYDIQYDEAGVSVGVSRDTAQFAVASIRGWWLQLGKKKFPNAKRILITADCGGSNSPRTILWRYELRRLSTELGLIPEVCHFPPGTSQWDKIEHRLFCHITGD